MMKKAERAPETELDEAFFLKLDKINNLEREERNKKVKENSKEGDEIVVDTFGFLVNLDDENSFPESYRNLTVEKLGAQIESELGHAFSYVYCYLPGRFGEDRNHTSGYEEQLERVKDFGKRYYDYIYNNEQVDRLWLRKQLWIIREECENMC